LLLISIQDLYKISSTYNSLVVSIIAILQILIGLYILKRKEPFAIYYIQGEIGFFVSIILISLGMRGYFENDHFASFGYIYGTFIDIIFLSFAIQKKIQSIIDENQRNQKLLIEQSKFIAIGRAMANISHQWKQPLTNLSSTFLHLEIVSRHKAKELKNEFDNSIIDINRQIEYLRNVVDDFYNLYSTKQETDICNIYNEVYASFSILKFANRDINIEVNLNIDKHLEIYSHKNLLINVFVNIIQNSIDEAKMRNINHKIDVYSDENIDSIVINFRDNAGGIKVNPIEKIFDDFFTTKKGSSNLGLGLSMTKNIVVNQVKGSIEAFNIDDGAIFKITLPKRI
jgi:signal transduction histidine kinase